MNLLNQITTATKESAKIFPSKIKGVKQWWIINLNFSKVNTHYVMLRQSQKENNLKL